MSLLAAMGQELAAAFPDKEAFAAAVATGVAEDEAAKEEAERIIKKHPIRVPLAPYLAVE